MKCLAACLLLAGSVQAADLGTQRQEMVVLQQEMIVLRYVDQDPGDPPYLTRILVTPDHLRMDGGEDGGDFVLLDRRRRQVINVMHDNKLALVFSAGEVPPAPAGWNVRLDQGDAARGTRRYSLRVRDVVCSEGITSAHAVPDAARALAEMKAILAATQYRVWQATPREMQHDCDLANQVWETGTTLQLGLPLEEREFSGRTRRFESESRQPLRPELFRLPADMATRDAPS